MNPHSYPNPTSPDFLLRPLPLPKLQKNHFSTTRVHFGPTFQLLQSDKTSKLKLSTLPHFSKSTTHRPFFPMFVLQNAITDAHECEKKNLVLYAWSANQLEDGREERGKEKEKEKEKEAALKQVAVDKVYCNVCRCRIQDYYGHVVEPRHKYMVKKNKFSAYINELAAKYQNKPFRKMVSEAVGINLEKSSNDEIGRTLEQWLIKKQCSGKKINAVTTNKLKDIIQENFVKVAMKKDFEENKKIKEVECENKDLINKADTPKPKKRQYRRKQPFKTISIIEMLGKSTQK